MYLSVLRRTKSIGEGGDKYRNETNGRGGMMKLRLYVFTQEQLKEIIGLPDESVSIHAKVAQDGLIEITVYSPEFTDRLPMHVLRREEIHPWRYAVPKKAEEGNDDLD